MGIAASKPYSTTYLCVTLGEQGNLPEPAKSGENKDHLPALWRGQMDERRWTTMCPVQNWHGSHHFSSSPSSL